MKIHKIPCDSEFRAYALISGDWSAGTNKKGLGEIHQTNPG